MYTHITQVIFFPAFYFVFQIRWLLEDEIVSALRHSWVISATTLQKVTQHVLSSSGRQHCHCEDVPLQFVFGPEQSLEKFKEARTLSTLFYTTSLCKTLCSRALHETYTPIVLANKFSGLTLTVHTRLTPKFKLQIYFCSSIYRLLW